MDETKTTLVVSRCVGERTIIYLPDDRTIEVELRKIRSPGAVELAFTAPKSIDILREELLDGTSRGPIEGIEKL